MENPATWTDFHWELLELCDLESLDENNDKTINKIVDLFAKNGKEVSSFEIKEAIISFYQDMSNGVYGKSFPAILVNLLER